MNMKPTEETSVSTLGPADWLLALGFTAILAITVLQVFCRYVLNNSLSWAEELVTYLFVWLVFIGVAVNVRDRSHIRVDILTRLLPPGVRKILEVGVELSMAAFMGAMVWLGFGMVRLMSGTESPALHLPVNYATYAALPLSFLAGAAYSLRHLVTALRNPDRSLPVPAPSPASGRKFGESSMSAAESETGSQRLE
jgi:TRAP-type C4-dicarboxylate transport system permease small subunit